jgi:hypothetical protein
MGRGMRQGISGIYLWACCLLIMLGMDLLLNATHAAEKKPSLSFENAQVRLQLFPRSNEQMAAFFEARGFPETMIAQLSEYCFFTVVIDNKMDAELWFDLSEWDFFAQQQRVPRIARSKWPPVWKSLNIPMASQSTFRWTLLPETFDFYANESEGGNIILQKTTAKFSLAARFGLGKQRRILQASVNNLQCADAGGGAR